jgi:hypothetical protein
MSEARSLHNVRKFRRSVIRNPDEYGPTEPVPFSPINPLSPLAPPIKLFLSPYELQKILDESEARANAPLTDEETPIKADYDSCITLFVSTLTRLADFYGVYIPRQKSSLDLPLTRRENSLKEHVEEQIKNTAISESALPSAATRMETWQLETAKCKEANTWYSNYWDAKVVERRETPARSGLGYKVAVGDWVLGFGWVGSTDSTHDSWENEERARNAEANAKMAKELGEIPPTDPVSDYIQNSLKEKSAPKWPKVFEAISIKRTELTSGAPAVVPP